MSQSVESKIPMAKRFFPGLLPIIGDEKYKQVVVRYQELFEKHGLPKHPALQWHLIQGILPGLAFYQVLRENGETQESALAMIDQTFEILFSDNFARMKKLGRLRFIYPFVLAHTQSSTLALTRGSNHLPGLFISIATFRLQINTSINTCSDDASPHLAVSFG